MQEEPWLPSDKPQGQVRIEDQVRPWVAGMKTLVISNRIDPELEQRLSEKLGLDITWAVCNVRRAQAQANGIRRNKYDLVIGQTGFMGHKVESIIAPACRDVQVPYIRADKARPASTALALIRDLGIDLTQKPPNDGVVRVSAPPRDSNNGKTRRRTIVTVPQQPSEYKDLDIDLLKFLEKQGDYFRMEDVLRSLRGIPVISTGSGNIDWNKMRRWTNAVAAMLRSMNYVSAQLPQAIDPTRPRVWVRRDKQGRLQNTRESVADSSRPARQPRIPAKPIPSSGTRPLRSSRKPAKNNRGQRWMVKYERAIRKFAKGKMYVHPEDLLRLLGVDLPPSKDIVWQDYMFWTKNMAPTLRKLGFHPRQRELPDGRRARVWIHGKAPRYMNVQGPGELYVDPRQPTPATVPEPPSVPTPVAQASAPPPSIPVPIPSVGPKSVRISYSSIQGGTMEEIVLALTQAGWSVSFGP